MGFYVPKAPVELLVADGTDVGVTNTVESSDLDTLGDIEVGDVLLYLRVVANLSGATSWTLHWKMRNPTLPANSNRTQLQNSLGSTSNDSNSSILTHQNGNNQSGWIVPGFENSTGFRSPFVRELVVVVGTRLEIEWPDADTPVVGDTINVHGIFACGS